MKDPRSYFVHTFGCRVNQADSAGVAAELDKGELVRTKSHLDADVVVLNTCTVTHRSDTDVRKTVNRIKRENPEAEIIVTGCYAQRDPEAAAELPGVGAVVGNAHKSRLPVIANDLLGTPQTGTPVIVHTPMDGVDPLTLPPVEPVTTVLDRTRPFVKIQDGCDATCTYCVIPAVRGRARSASPEDVQAAVQNLVEQGYVEIVLAGVHLGTYDSGPQGARGLDDLVKKLLQVPGLIRLRMSCIEPMAFPTGLLDVARGDPRLAPHFHLPLQSGHDHVLKRMVRPYRAKHYARLIADIKAKVPDACIGSDVIVGFPGETDEEFLESCRFIEEDSGIDYLHVFSYSDREGVPSTRLGPKVGPRIIKERSGALHKVAERIWARYLDAQIGTTRPAVSLKRNPRNSGLIEVLTDNYCPVLINEPDLQRNQDLLVTIQGREGNRCVGVLQTRPA